MISFDNNAADNMLAHASRLFPDECCGFLYGRESADGNRLIQEIAEVDNAKEGDKRRRFEISARDYLRAERRAVEKDISLLGVYHSHPNHPAIPSEHDRIAAQPYFSYIIISVMEGRIDHVRSWKLGDDAHFREEQLIPIPFNQLIK